MFEGNEKCKTVNVNWNSKFSHDKNAVNKSLCWQRISQKSKWYVALSFSFFLSFCLDAPQVSLYSKEFDRSIHASRSHKCCIVSKPDSCGHGGVVIEWNQLLPLLAQVNPDKINKLTMNNLILWQTWKHLFFYTWSSSVNTFTNIALAFTSHYSFTRLSNFSLYFALFCAK